MRTEIMWIVLILVVLGGVTVLQFLPHQLTGEVTALGGRITNVNLTVKNTASYWAGLYGEVVESASSPSSINVTLQRGQTLERNVSLDCVGGELYVSRTLVSNLETSAAGTAEMIDNNLSIANNPESATRMFTLNKTFVVGTTTYTLPTTTTLSEENGTFDEGILNNSGTLVFATHIVSNKNGFDGNPHDYQLLLPVSDQETRYVLYNDCTNASTNTSTNVYYVTSPTPSKNTRAKERPAAAGGGAGGEAAPEEIVVDEVSPEPDQEEPDGGPTINYTAIPGIYLPNFIPQLNTISFFLSFNIIVVILLTITFVLIRRKEKDKRKN
mgnify:CR=1 FL=1